MASRDTGARVLCVAALCVLPLASLAVPASAASATAGIAAPGLVPAPVPIRERIDEHFGGYGKPVLLDDGDEFGPWRVVFDGVDEGRGVRVHGGVLRLKPQVAPTPAQTNASLVVSRRSFRQQGLHLSATWTGRYTTRVGVANPWETGWLVWDYLDNDHFTYLVLKPNGWEVGRRDPTMPGGQRFIADGTDLLTPIGVTRTATVDRIGGETTIRVGGEELVTITVPPTERYGSVGMYSEDAVVDWTRIFVATFRSGSTTPSVAS